MSRDVRRCSKKARVSPTSTNVGTMNTSSAASVYAVCSTSGGVYMATTTWHRGVEACSCSIMLSSKAWTPPSSDMGCTSSTLQWRSADWSRRAMKAAAAERVRCRGGCATTRAPGLDRNGLP